MVLALEGNKIDFHGHLVILDVRRRSLGQSRRVHRPQEQQMTKMILLQAAGRKATFRDQSHPFFVGLGRFGREPWLISSVESSDPKMGVDWFGGPGDSGEVLKPVVRWGSGRGCIVGGMRTDRLGLLR